MENSPRQKQEFIDPRTNVKEYPANILGVGKAFAKSVKNRIKYVEDTGKYHYFDGIRWRMDRNKIHLETEIRNFALFLDSLMGTVDDVVTVDGKKQSDPYMSVTNSLQYPEKWSSFDKASRLDNYVSRCAFDSDGNNGSFGLFNCKNGTYDLDKMEYRSHDPTDMLTKVAGVLYDKDAKCAEWDSFINEIMCGEVEMVRYLQKVMGYAITTDTRLECMWFLYGSKSRNGKSTFINTIAKVMGDYARNVQPASIAKRSSLDGSKASSDLARLAGSRLVNISEPPAGFKVDSAQLKQQTGNDAMTVRPLYQEFFEYIPKHKMFVVTNHLPAITDDALFASGRIVVISFNRHFTEEEQNKELKHIFSKPENLSAVLNWLIEGLRLYKAEGLEQPKAVQDAIKEYRRNADSASLFITECVEPCEDSKSLREKFHAAYTEWCSANQLAAVKQNVFYDLLKHKLNIKHLNKNDKDIAVGGRYVVGYQLKKTS